MKYSTRQIVLTAVFCAFGILFPLLFHFIALGSVFLPMFLPLLIVGFLVDLPLAIVVGAMTPIVSSVTTGMPPLSPPIAPLMAIEGAVLAGTASLLYRKFHLNIWVTMIAAIASERFILFVAAFLFAPVLGIPGEVLSLVSVVKGFPGVIMLLIVTPIAVKKIESMLSLNRANNDFNSTQTLL